MIQGLKEAGIDFASGVPDAQFIEVYKMLAEDRGIRYVGAANEAEAIGIGFGAGLAAEAGADSRDFRATGRNLPFGAHQSAPRSSGADRDPVPR